MLSNQEKWQRANWRKAYEARLKEMAVFPEQPAVLEEKLPEGMIMAFATAPGGIASDGEDQHGPYTKYLLQEMQKSKKIEEVFQKVSKSVRETTNGKQVPWYNTSLSSGSFCFGGCSRTSSKLVKQLALVIGNANYSRAPLKNTINDAQAIAKFLNEKGFEVILQTRVRTYF